MKNKDFSTKLNNIKHFIWRQAWSEARAACRAIIDDPDVDDTSLAKAQALLETVKTKARADAQIQSELDAVQQSLTEPNPEYRSLLEKIDRALALGREHSIPRWERQFQELKQQILRRSDMRVRMEADHRRFQEARQADNYEAALSIAQRLLADAELNEQPEAAQSARKWLQQIGRRIELDQLAQSIEAAFDRDDYEWGLELFEQLPSTHPDYQKLYYRRIGAEAELNQLKNTMARVEASWKRGRAEETEEAQTSRLNEAKMLLNKLARRYANNHLWHALWLRFYSDIARRANRRADQLVSERHFEAAGQAYRKGEQYYQRLRQVFEDDANLINMQHIAHTSVSLCGHLSEALNARERLDLATARAACRKARQDIENVPEIVQKATGMLQQQIAVFEQELETIASALDDLQQARERIDAGDDIYQVVEQLNQVLAIGNILPAQMEEQAAELRAEVQNRTSEVDVCFRKAEELRPTDPQRAAEHYIKAWQLSHNTDVRTHILKFLWEQFEQSNQEKRPWLEYILTVAPEHERATNELLTLDELPELEKQLLPLRAKLEDLEGRSKVSTGDLHQIKQQLDGLAVNMARTPKLKAIVEKDIQRWNRIDADLHEAQLALQEADRQTQAGTWAQAIHTLEQTAVDLEVEGQRRRLKRRAASLREQFQQAEAEYKQARHLYQQAVTAYQRLPETAAYDTVEQQIQQAKTAFKNSASLLAGHLPRPWQQFEEELQAFKYKSEIVLETWRASHQAQQPLVELVKELRELAVGEERTDPVIDNLLHDLTERAVTECVQKARQAEKEGYEEQALDHVETALLLGGRDPELEQWQRTLSQRRERAERIIEIQTRIRNLLNKSGQLGEISRLQAQLLELRAADTGDERLMETAKQFIDTISPEIEEMLRSAKQKAKDGEETIESLRQVREQYRAALSEAHRILKESLRPTAERIGHEGRRVLKEAKEWLHFKERQSTADIATSMANLNEFIKSAKAFKNLRDSARPGEYDYDNEYINARNSMLDAVLGSARKRKEDAEVAITQGQYEVALDDLAAVEEEFYGPVETELPELQARLNEKGLPLGDLRAEVRELFQTAQRLKQVAAQLREREKEAAALFREATQLETTEKVAHLREALTLLQEARRDDPDEECTVVLKRLDKLAEQIETALHEERLNQARSTIRRAERELKKATTEEAYQQIETLLNTVDAELIKTDIEYKNHYDKVYEDIQQRGQLPGKLELADKKVEQGQFTQAAKIYQEILDTYPGIATALPDFTSKLNNAQERAQEQDEIHTLRDHAIEVMYEQPMDAIKSLGEALMKANLRGLTRQAATIQQLMNQAKALDYLKRARAAWAAKDPQKSQNHANLALQLAKESNDSSIVTEAKELLHDIRDDSANWEAEETKKIEAQRLLSDQHWQEAWDMLITLNLPADNFLLEEAEQGKRTADRRQREIEGLIDQGKFVEASSRLNMAKVQLEFSAERAQKLQDVIENAESQMEAWNQQLEQIVEPLSGTPLVQVDDILEAITQVEQLINEADLVKEMRSAAGQLLDQLKGLKQQLETMNRVITQAKEQLDLGDAMMALKTLDALDDQFILKYGGESHHIRHSGSNRIAQIRNDAIARQFATMQRQVDTAEDSLLDVLKRIRESWEHFKSYLENSALDKFEDYYAQLTLLIEVKETEIQCQNWEAQLKDAEELWHADQVENALKIAEAVQTEIDAQRQNVDTPSQVWESIGDIWKEAFILQRSIESDREQEVDQRIQEALADLESAEHDGDIHKLTAVSSELKAIRNVPQLTERQRGQVADALERLTQAKDALVEAQETLEEIEQAIKLQDYDRALQHLSRPCPLAFQEKWEALHTVISGLKNGHQLLSQKTNIPYDQLRGKLRNYDRALQDNLEILNSWPEVLPERKMTNRKLRNDMERLTVQLRQTLCDVTQQVVRSELNRGNPEEAERLIKTALDEDWAPADQEVRFEDLKHEVKVTQAALELERLLTLGDEVDAAAATLKQRLNQPHDISDLRRQKVQGLLRLVSIKELLTRGEIELAQEYVNDPALLHLGAPFDTLSRQVNLAVKERAKLKGWIEQMNRIIYAPHGKHFGDVALWLPNVKKAVDEDHPLIKEKFKKLQERIQQEIQTAREEVDYARLKALNPLALDLELAEPNLADLIAEQKSKLQKEIQQAQDALEAYDPESAAPHIHLAERLAEKPEDKETVSQLKAKLYTRQQLCADVDKLISRAKMCIAHNQHEEAVDYYRQAEEKASGRTTVTQFAERQHEIFLRAFEEARLNEKYLQAENVARQALDFGFQAQTWQETKQSVMEERDHKVQTLIENLAGPGYQTGPQTEPFTAGLLGSADPDLEEAKENIRHALRWDSDNQELKNLLAIVNQRLKSVAEMRVDVRRAWVALDDGDYAGAEDLFASANQKLEQEHPEVSRWKRLANLLKEGTEYLQDMQSSTSEPIDIKDTPGRVGVRVVHENWPHIRSIIQEVASIFSNPTLSRLLGEDGLEQQRHIKDMANTWLNYVETVDTHIDQMEEKYNQARYEEGLHFKKEALHTFELLYNAVTRHRRIIVPASSAEETAEEVEYEESLKEPRVNQPTQKLPKADRGTTEREVVSLVKEEEREPAASPVFETSDAIHPEASDLPVMRDDPQTDEKVAAQAEHLQAPSQPPEDQIPDAKPAPVEALSEAGSGDTGLDTPSENEVTAQTAERDTVSHLEETSPQEQTKDSDILETKQPVPEPKEPEQTPDITTRAVPEPTPIEPELDIQQPAAPEVADPEPTDEDEETYF